MRIINFGVKEDDIPYFQRYSEELDLECVIVKNNLTPKTSYLLEGADAVTDSMSHQYDEAVYQTMKQQGIKYFSLRSAGYDNLNYQLAAKYGIRMARVPDYSPNAIAEHSIALALTLLRNLHVGYMRFHNQDYRIDGLIGREVRDFRIGVLGTGHIGKVAAKMWQGFGGKVLAYDVKPDPEVAQWLDYVDDFDQFLTQIDLLAIYLPLNPTTKYIVNRQTIAKLPKGAIVINVARGGHVDTKALYDALKSGHLSGAALDVYENEGMIYHKDLSCQYIDDEVFRKLESMPNTFITPHIAYNTDRAVQNMVKSSLENVIEMAKNNRINNEII